MSLLHEHGVTVPDAIAEYCAVQLDRLQSNLDHAGRTCAVVSIHDFRVAAKRLRALFRLVAQLSDSFNARRRFKKIRRLFRTAGRVRDCHVQMELVREYAADTDSRLDMFINLLKAEEMAARDAFRQAATKTAVQKIGTRCAHVIHALSDLDPTTCDQRAREAFDQRVTHLVDLCEKQELEIVDYHDIRKVSKEARYVLEIVRRVHPDDHRLKAANTILRDIHRALGRWHDYDLGVLRIQSLLASHAEKGTDNLKVYRRYRDHLKFESDVAIRAFESAWSHFRLHRDEFTDQ